MVLKQSASNLEAENRSLLLLIIYDNLEKVKKLDWRCSSHGKGC